MAIAQKGKSFKNLFKLKISPPKTNLKRNYFKHARNSVATKLCKAMHEFVVRRKHYCVILCDNYVFHLNPPLKLRHQQSFCL